MVSFRLMRYQDLVLGVVRGFAAVLKLDSLLHFKRSTGGGVQSSVIAAGAGL